jgi:Mg/Co/Ni transporter MgtE
MKRKLFFMAVLFVSFLAVQTRASAQKDAPEEKKDGGAVSAILGTGSKFVPVFVSVRLASRMKPETVASLSSSMPVERAVAISKGLDRDFLTEVTCHLDPVKGAPIIEKCPDDLSIDVVKRLIRKNKAAVAGRLADHLSTQKLVSLSKGLTPPENVQIGYTMTQKSLIAKVLSANPDDYIVSMLNECIRLSYFQLIADVVQEMDSARNIRILEGMKMNNRDKTLFLARLSKHLSPAKSGEVIQQCPNRIIADVVIQMIKDGDAAVLGGFSDTLPREKLVSVSALLTTGQKIQVGYTMKNRRLIAGILTGYPDAVLVDLLSETLKLGYYDLIADVVQEMDPSRNIRILNAMNLDREAKTRFLTKLARYLTPAKSAEIIDKCPDRAVADAVESLIKEGDAKITGGFSDRLSRKKLESVSKLLTASDRVQVANAMKKKRVIAEILSAFPDSEITALLNEATRLGYHDLIADMVGLMKKERVKKVLSSMDGKDIEKLSDKGTFK